MFAANFWKDTGFIIVANSRVSFSLANWFPMVLVIDVLPFARRFVAERQLHCWNAVRIKMVARWCQLLLHEIYWPFFVSNTCINLLTRFLVVLIRPFLFARISCIYFVKFSWVFGSKRHPADVCWSSHGDGCRCDGWRGADASRWRASSIVLAACGAASFSAPESRLATKFRWLFLSWQFRGNPETDPGKMHLIRDMVTWCTFKWPRNWLWFEPKKLHLGGSLG